MNGIKNMLVREIKKDNKVLAIILAKSSRKDGTNFFSRPESSLQLGTLYYPKNHKVNPHYHRVFKRIIRSTQELFFVVEGKVRANIFDRKGEKIKSVILSGGDAILLLDGGHGLDFLEKSKILMIKQGPYLGKKEDKAYIK